MGEFSEQEYADIYKVSLAQMCWRRGKILELRDPAAFRREYPAAPGEAWTAPPGMEPFIGSQNVTRARKRTGVQAVGPLILGVDPASNGGDRFAVAARRGNVVMWVEYRNRIDSLEGTAWIRQLIDDLNPARVCIDAGNIGQAIITNLKSIGPKYATLVRGVNFGGTSQAKLAMPKIPGPGNRRAEMWQRLQDWLNSPEPAKLPDMEALQTDITAPKLVPKLNNDFLLESKVEMKKRGVRSPDLADSVALTFAFNEFFTDAQLQDKQAAQFGSGEHLQTKPAPGYIPPAPLAAHRGWVKWQALSINFLANRTTPLTASQRVTPRALTLSCRMTLTARLSFWRICAGNSMMIFSMTA
jgi:hypothetical protein